jgi:hypothetical protein
LKKGLTRSWQLGIIIKLIRRLPGGGERVKNKLKKLLTNGCAADILNKLSPMRDNKERKNIDN